MKLLLDRAIGQRFVLLLGTIALALVLAFWALPDQPAIWFVTHAGYWFVWVAFGIFLWAAWQTLRPRLVPPWRALLNWEAVAAVGIATAVLLVHETFGFKILMDEIMLLGTSMSMHFNRTALVPERGNDIQGTFVILSGVLDKRPLFFPFLLSLVHDIVGYRPTNAFLLNGGLTVTFLGLVWTVAKQLGGRLAAWLALLLLAGLPLLAQNASGGGFELLNLVMITTAVAFGARCLQEPSDAAIVALAYSGILLAQVRYESVIYLLPVALLIGLVWYREQRVRLPWPLLLAPLLMIHYPLQNRVFSIRTSSWEMMSKPGYTTPFSVRYVGENLYHAFRFFFGRSTEQPNSLVLSTFCFLALPFFLLLLVRTLQSRRQVSSAMLSFYIFSIGFALQFALLMLYFWGKFDEHVISRLSLPTILFLVLALACVLAELRSALLNRMLVAGAAVGLLALSIPAMSARAYDQEYSPAREVRWREQFMAAHPRNDYLMVDNDSILWITHQVTATPVLQAQQRREALMFNFRNKTFSDFFAFQRFDVDPDTGKLKFQEGEDLGANFVLEPVQEVRLRFLTLTRISRIKEIRDGANPPPPPPPEPLLRPAEKKVVEKVRQAYFENFLKDLP